MNLPETAHPARWWHSLPDGRIQCDLCPRDCQLHDGQRGACFVRKRLGQGMVLTTWGRSSGFCLDPIEKKPLNHFHPGSSVLSFGTAGCNLTCRFCQNWDISKARDMDCLMHAATPAAIAAAARAHGADSVAYTYNDPVVFAEYALDVAAACRTAGILNVAVTAGYIHAEPRREFFAAMDAANVDLKSFSEEFYHRHCGAHLTPVLDTLVHIRHATDCWLEITTLLIPGANDFPAEIAALSSWVERELGAGVPLHFTAFHPDWKMTDTPPTPPSTLARARRIAQDAGLQYVYTGNVHDPAGGSTFCPGCARALVVRNWYEVSEYTLTPGGHCPHCGTIIAGRFGHGMAAGRPAFGRQRRRVLPEA